MALTEKTTHVLEGLRLQLEQFKGKTNVEGLLTAWISQVQELEAASFTLVNSRSIDGASDAQLDLLGALVGVERLGRTDAVYRVYIKAQIGINIGSGTPDELLRLFALVTGQVVDLQEYPPAALTISLDAAGLSAATLAGYANVLSRARAACVHAHLVYAPEGTPFRFDTAGAGFDAGELAGALEA